MSDDAGDIADLLAAVRDAWASGRLAEAVERAREIVRACDGDGASDDDACVVACAVAAESLAELGDARGALDWIARGRRRLAAGGGRAAGADARDLRLALAEAHVLTLGGAPQDAVRPLEGAVAGARAAGRDVDLADALGRLAWVRALLPATADAEAARVAAEEAGALDAADVMSPVPRLAALSRALARLGRVEEADAAVSEALAAAQRRGERGLEGWAWLVAADVALARGDAGDAEARLDEAQDAAEECAMRPLLERCRAALRRLGS